MLTHLCHNSFWSTIFICNIYSSYIYYYILWISSNKCYISNSWKHSVRFSNTCSTVWEWTPQSRMRWFVQFISQIWGRLAISRGKVCHKTQHGQATRRLSVVGLAAGTYRGTLKGRVDHRPRSCKSSVDSTFCRPMVTAARAVLTPPWLLLNWLVARAPPMILNPLGEFFFSLKWSVGQCCGPRPCYAGTIVRQRVQSGPPSTSHSDLRALVSDLNARRKAIRLPLSAEGKQSAR